MILKPKAQNEFKSIDEIICAYIDSNKKTSKEKRGQNYWFASSLGKCLRYQFFQRKGVETEGTVKYTWQNNAMDGHAMHDWRQKAIVAMEAMSSYEEEIVNNNLNYRGHHDGIVILGDRHVLVDFKTQSNRAFRKRSSDKINLGIDPCHRRQLGSYYLFVKENIDPLVEEARLYYINRETGEREEYKVDLPDEYLKEIIDELTTLNKHWETKTVPKSEKSYVFCNKICPFKNLCEFYGHVGHPKFIETQRQDPGVQELPFAG
jgi:CRISPR/Cas system-associated exonuclease Cas4 (RecB family)